MKAGEPYVGEKRKAEVAKSPKKEAAKEESKDTKKRDLKATAKKTIEPHQVRSRFSANSSAEGSLSNFCSNSENALLILLMTLYNRIDAIMLERLLDDNGEQAGIYAAGYRLLDAVNVFGLLFASLLLPMFAKMLKERISVQTLTLTSFQMILAFSTSVAITCYFFSNEIMALLYPDATAYWATVFSWLMFSFIPITSVYIFGTLMTAVVDFMIGFRANYLILTYPQA